MLIDFNPLQQTLVSLLNWIKSGFNKNNQELNALSSRITVIENTPVSPSPSPSPSPSSTGGIAVETICVVLPGQVITNRQAHFGSWVELGTGYTGVADEEDVGTSPLNDDPLTSLVSVDISWDTFPTSWFVNKMLYDPVYRKLYYCKSFNEIYRFNDQGIL